MDLGLEGKIALVVAASKGLGRASALALAREGARVAICARDEAALARAAEEIRRETGAEVHAVSADVSRAQDIAGVVSGTAERFGGLDILVNNSGGPPVGKFDDLDDDDWQRGFEVVTMNFVRFVRAAVPHMRERKWGRIVAIQSTSVKQPVPYIDTSNGIRPGIAGLMKALTGDLARDGITINLVLPGVFRTARLHPDLDSEDPAARHTAEEQLAPLAERVPLGRLGEPIELADLVAFLASQRSSYITGAVYQVDGGSIASNV